MSTQEQVIDSLMKEIERKNILLRRAYYLVLRSVSFNPNIEQRELLKEIQDEADENRVENPKVKCVCGWKGRCSNLTAKDGEDEVRCPRCGTVGWHFVD